MSNCPCCNIVIDYVQIKNKKCNNCLHEWEVFHVMPVNDLKEHSESHTCCCVPTLKNESGNVIVLHNSFDGRENFEWDNDVVKN